MINQYMGVAPSTFQVVLYTFFWGGTRKKPGKNALPGLPGFDWDHRIGCLDSVCQFGYWRRQGAESWWRCLTVRYGSLASWKGRWWSVSWYIYIYILTYTCLYIYTILIHIICICCWWKESCTSWGWQFIPLFTTFFFCIPGGCLGFLNHQLSSPKSHLAKFVQSSASTSRHDVLGSPT